MAHQKLEIHVLGKELLKNTKVNVTNSGKNCLESAIGIVNF